MTFAEFFPELRPWVENLVNVWPAYIIKPQFASWQVLHILSMVILGGCTILLNLRLIGFGLTTESPSEIYRSLRMWLHVGVVGIVISGILIGMANAERLYDSSAFLVKMIALVAGVIFTYGVSAPIAKADGRVGPGAKLAGLLGVIVFGAGLYIFVTSDLINPGLFHVISAAALVVLFVTRGALRWTYLAVMLALIAVQFYATHIMIKPDDFERLDPVNIAFAWIFAGVVTVAAAIQLVAKSDGVARDNPALAKIFAYMTILVWVAASAAGRWIAFA